MQFLKSVVIGMAVLIALAIGFLIYGLVKKSSEPNWKPFAAITPAAPASDALPPFGDVSLDLPPQCQIVSTYGESGRLIFELETAEGCPDVIVLDLATGKRLGSVRLR